MNGVYERGFCYDFMLDAFEKPPLRQLILIILKSRRFYVNFLLI